MNTEEKSKKIGEIVRNEEFIEKLLDTATQEEVKELFKSEGIELEDSEVDEIVNIVVKSTEMAQNMTDDELQNISGGVWTEWEKGFASGAAMAITASFLTSVVTGVVKIILKKRKEQQQNNI